MTDCKKWVCICGVEITSTDYPQYCPKCGETSGFDAVPCIELLDDADVTQPETVRSVGDIAIDLGAININLIRVGDELEKYNSRDCYCDADCGISCRECLEPLRARLHDLYEQILDVRHGLFRRDYEPERAALKSLANSVRDAIDDCGCGGAE